jgi:hypothetical protein
LLTQYSPTKATTRAATTIQHTIIIVVSHDANAGALSDGFAEGKKIHTDIVIFHNNVNENQ